MSNIQPPAVNDAKLAELRGSIADSGQLFAGGQMVTDGVNSAKVQAFTRIMEGSRDGYVADGMEKLLVGDWHAAIGQPLDDKGMASAASKCKVWIMAGRSNYAPATFALMVSTASSDKKLAGRFFEKMTTALRRTKKEGRPLTEIEVKAILTGVSDQADDPLADLVAALKRVVGGYKAAREVEPDDVVLAQREAQAVVDLEVAENRLKARDTALKMAKLNQTAQTVAQAVSVISQPVVTAPAPQVIAAAHAVDSDLFLAA